MKRIEKLIERLESVRGRDNWAYDDIFSQSATTLRDMLAVVKAAKEVAQGQDQPHVFSSGQVFVDVGSLRAMETAIAKLEQDDG